MREMVRRKHPHQVDRKWGAQAIGKPVLPSRARVFSHHVALFAMSLLIAVFLTACGQSAESPSIKDSVNDYSWSELSAISNEIAMAPDGNAALEIAKKYHLTLADGTLDGTQRKDIQLADGSRTSVAIAGFRHDDAVTGEKAGITFIFDDAIAYRPMNNNAGFDDLDIDDDLNTFGGWQACELRNWLNGEFLDELPSDLRTKLAKVVKTSFAISNYELPLGTDYTTESVLTETVDQMWVPAIVELSGVSGDTERAEQDIYRTENLRHEGTQYQLFADVGIVEQDGVGNEALVRSLARGGNVSGTRNNDGSDVASGEECGWWLRGTEHNSFSHVTEDGAIDRNKYNSGNPLGVVPCFAI